MASSLSDDLKKTFALASLRNEAAKILTPKEWNELQKIKQKYEGQKQFEKRSFDLEYETRVEVARKRLINQAGQNRKNFQPLWARNDRFDRDAIDRQAHRNVKDGFKRLIEQFELRERRDVQGLLDRCEHSRKQREKPKQDFNQAADRRRSFERRQTRSRGLTR